MSGKFLPLVSACLSSRRLLMSKVCGKLCILVILLGAVLTIPTKAPIKATVIGPCCATCIGFYTTCQNRCRSLPPGPDRETCFNVCQTKVTLCKAECGDC